MSVRNFDEWKLQEGVPDTPFGIQVGDYFSVSGNLILEGNVLSRDDKAGNRWRSIKCSPNGTRTFTHSKRDSGLNSAILREIGEEAAYFLKATRVHPTYLEGIVKFGNGLMNVAYQMRVNAEWVQEPNESLLDIFLRYDREMTKARGEKRFIVGDEDFLYNEDGTQKTDVVPGVYLYYTTSFELTRVLKEPMLYCGQSEAEIDKTKEKNFYIGIGNFMELKKAPSEGEADTVSKWFSKQIGAECTFDKEKGTEVFNIPHFRVMTPSSNGKPTGHPGEYIAAPFFTRAKAQRHIDDLKRREKEGDVYPFDVDKLVIVESGKYTFTFVKLMDYAKLLGIDINMRKLFHDKRGQISSKEFGIS